MILNHLFNHIRLYYIMLLFIVISTNNTYLFFSNMNELIYLEIGDDKNLILINLEN